jgi:pantothenate synthetase
VGTNESELTVEELISRVGNFDYRHDQPLWTRYAKMAEVKLQLENIALTKRNQEISEKQLDVSNEANELTKRLLLSNEQASKDSEKNAELMNNATQELAKSTKSLKWATWVLVGFTAVQALIALAALFKN